ncbi:AAA family ATPase [Candidatus Pacearchaeota archaeon]|nr:AAA family ATPase [Candidatus Pacearchaeota archaeon]
MGEQEKKDEFEKLLDFKMKNNLEKEEWLYPPSKEFVSEKEIYIDPVHKRDLEKILNAIKHPEIFGTELGYGGVLLKGPQGAGKTYFARHVAYLTNADFVLVKYLGDPRFVIKLFDEARDRAKAKPQLLFIDEIEKYGRRDGTIRQCQEATLQQILDETGIKKLNYNILLMGATNLPDALDPALRRGGGRFGKEVEFYALGRDGRHNVLKILANNLAEGVLEAIDPTKKGHKFKISEPLLSEMADLTHGYANGDLTELLTETFHDAYCDGERLEVKIDDVKKGLKEVEPSALKEMPTKGLTGC